MKIGAAAIALSSLALAGVVLVYAKLDRLENKLEARSPERAAPVERERPRRSTLRSTPSHLRTRPSKDIAMKPKPPAEEAAPPATPPTRKKVHDAARELETRLAATKLPGIQTTEQLAEELALTKTQQERIGSLVKFGRRRVDAVLRLPDGNGVSPLTRRKELQVLVDDALATGKWQDVLAAMKEPGARNEPIPGGNGTYGEAVAQVVEETRNSILGNLTLKQQRELGDLAALLNPGGFEPSETVAHAKQAAARPND